MPFGVGMAHEEMIKDNSKLSSYDAYFEKIQSRKKLPQSLQETLTAAFADIPVSSFPQVPGGKGECFYSMVHIPSQFSLENGFMQLE